VLRNETELHVDSFAKFAVVTAIIAWFLLVGLTYKGLLWWRERKAIAEQRAEFKLLAETTKKSTKVMGPSVDDLIRIRDEMVNLNRLEDEIEKVLEGVEPYLACVALTTKLIKNRNKLTPEQLAIWMPAILKDLQRPPKQN
jgi:hypothetical protein